MVVFTHDYGHAVQEIGGSNPDHDTIIGGDFQPTRQLARFSPQYKSYIVNLFIISPRGEI